MHKSFHVNHSITGAQLAALVVLKGKKNMNILTCTVSKQKAAVRAFLLLFFSTHGGTNTRNGIYSIAWRFMRVRKMGFKTVG